MEKEHLHIVRDGATSFMQDISNHQFDQTLSSAKYSFASRLLNDSTANVQGYSEFQILLKMLTSVFKDLHILLVWIDKENERGGVVHGVGVPNGLVHGLQNWIGDSNAVARHWTAESLTECLRGICDDDQAHDHVSITLNNGGLFAAVVMIGNSLGPGQAIFNENTRGDIAMALQIALALQSRRLSSSFMIDTATLVASREVFVNAVEAEIRRPRELGQPFAVAIVDFDRFMLVNNAFGPEIVNDILRMLVQRIVDFVSPKDLVARLGGDEFAILIRDQAEIDDLVKLGGKLAAALRKPVEINGHTARITASIGLARWSPETEHLHGLIRNANLALQYVKHHGKNGSRLYDETMVSERVSSIIVEDELEKALRSGEFRLVFQPRVSVDGGQAIESAEALIRWHHPTRGIVQPGDFIPIAEEGHLIVQIGDFVIREVCRQLNEWKSVLDVLPRIAINVSGKQLTRHKFASKLKHVMREFDIPPGCLEMEITETAVMEFGREMLETVQFLRDQGIRVAIDDFGTGYATLDVLKQFPTDYLKIDKSFVQDLGGRNKAIVSMIIQLAHSIDAKVIAEGVETPEQRDFLIEKGCDEMQGYLYSRPVSPDEFVKRCIEALDSQVNE